MVAFPEGQFFGQSEKIHSPERGEFPWPALLIHLFIFISLSFPFPSLLLTSAVAGRTSTPPAFPAPGSFGPPGNYFCPGPYALFSRPSARAGPRTAERSPPFSSAKQHNFLSVEPFSSRLFIIPAKRRRRRFISVGYDLSRRSIQIL